ncbi:MAG TPA: hypothetical protein VNG89_06670 [Vicinamibacterales bacterium]|nr:hypothetical protein [Vicinamibacterales bacterium]
MQSRHPARSRDEAGGGFGAYAQGPSIVKPRSEDSRDDLKVVPYDQSNCGSEEIRRFF